MKSEDIVTREYDDGLYPAEFVNIAEASGVPPQKIRLKVGTPVMILLNLNAASGMRNGSKSILRRTRPRRVEVDIAPERNSGLREFTARLPLQSSDSDPPFPSGRYHTPPSALLRNYSQQNPATDHPARRIAPNSKCISPRSVVCGNGPGDGEA